MNESAPHRVIKTFFGKHFSKDAQMHFRFWFLNSPEKEEKDAAELEVWNNCSSIVTDDTWKDLEKIKAKIDKEPVNSHRVNPAWWMIAASLLLIIATAVSVRLLDNAAIKPLAPEMLECYVPLGESRSLTLPDSSKIFLNAGSMLIYPKRFSAETRKIFLTGEARVLVAKDPRKPFIISTHNMDVQALGTVFNVSDYQHSHIATSTLEEGSIRVQVKAVNSMPAILSPGEQLIYDSAAKKITVRKVDAARASAWVEGYLVFDNAPFEEVIKALERRFDVTINYDADKYYGHSYCVKFAPGETIEDAMQILSQLIDGFNYSIANQIISIR
ncbi:MAG: FecR domain-containing protein [Bacteroidales bacterium]|jgi:ferric-dicitrate binding protein FerR (iron transport regulator)|nr:FecR domain-containing protein [Bacteroidales bacterium]MCI2133740.1 FecR domain-containing protein [Bacteroidales bacterium]